MPLDDKLLKILVCPISKTPLHPASAKYLAALNKRINQQEICRNDGQLVTATITEALLTEDETVVYPIRNGIPVLLYEEAIQMGTA